jgi:citrate synthase
LFAVAQEAGAPMHFVRIAEAIEKVLPALTKRDLRLNVSAAIPAVLLDIGFSAEALKGVPILARCAGVIGHLTEELSHPIGFALSYQATREQQYTGKSPPGFTPHTAD